MSEEDKLTSMMGEGFKLITELAHDNGYCPGCFLKAFADAVLSYDKNVGLQHVDGVKGLMVLKPMEEEDDIGETAGNA